MKLRLVIGMLLLAFPASGCGARLLPASPVPPAAAPTLEAATEAAAASAELPAPTPAPTPLPSPTTAATIPPSPTPAPTAPPLPTPAPLRSPVTVGVVGMDGALVQGSGGLPWWNDSVFYEVFVRSFYDSDGDGVGDLTGLISKLDYLNDGDPATMSDLGITGIWLMPVAQSPSYHGYDVTDYTRVDDEYGTGDDFRRLMAEAHRRGMRVIVDLVLNHTSSQHPWFLEASDPSSPRRDWYIWSAENPLASNWHKAADGSYYYGYFWEGMPDLNYRTPAVTEEMFRIARFWLQEMGVDGFRLDAVKYLLEDGRVIANAPATHQWLADFRAFYKAVKPDAFTVGEVWAETGQVAGYVGGELDTAFEFTMADAMLEAAAKGRRSLVVPAQEAVVAAYPPGQFASFLTNHDQNRVRSVLISDDQARAAASLLLGFPGVPFIYYGEEIGLQGAKPDEDIRRPMQWSADGGFTSGTPWRDYYEDYQERHVAAQDADPASLLNHYRAWIRLRNEHEALRSGEWLPIESDHKAVYACLRATGSEQVLVLLNLGFEPVAEYQLTLGSGPLAAGVQPALLMGAADRLAAPEVDEAGGFAEYRPVEELAPYSTYVLQLLP